MDLEIVRASRVSIDSGARFFPRLSSSIRFPLTWPLLMRALYHVDRDRTQKSAVERLVVLSRSSRAMSLPVVSKKGVLSKLSLLDCSLLASLITTLRFFATQEDIQAQSAFR